MAGYLYIGPSGLISRNDGRRHVQSTSGLVRWFIDHREERDAEDLVPATYIVDLRQNLWIADRRSEHVACAHGEPVLAAGELFIDLEGRIARFSNQSTGYCPPVETCRLVKSLLEQFGIPAPLCFEPACEFRRCEICGERQIVKDGDLSCVGCGADLPFVWNIGNQ